jgi:hypothetical protein
MSKMQRIHRGQMALVTASKNDMQLNFYPLIGHNERIPMSHSQ